MRWQKKKKQKFVTFQPKNRNDANSKIPVVDNKKYLILLKWSFEIDFVNSPELN